MNISGIIASGENATYGKKRPEKVQKMQRGDLLTISFGCELYGYSAEIARCFPVCE